MKRRQGIDHGRHGHQSEEAGADPADAVAEVQQADGQGTEDDGEIEP